MTTSDSRPLRREKKIRKKGAPAVAAVHDRRPDVSAPGANKILAAPTEQQATGEHLQSSIDTHPSAIADLQSSIENRQSEIVSLLPYQRRWIEDNSPLKIVVKARQIGYSFAATLRVVFECLKRKTTWILLSKGERQSRLLMEKVQEHIQSCGIVAA